MSMQSQNAVNTWVLSVIFLKKHDPLISENYFVASWIWIIHQKGDCWSNIRRSRLWLSPSVSCRGCTSSFRWQLMGWLSSSRHKIGRSHLSSRGSWTLSCIAHSRLNWVSRSTPSQSRLSWHWRSSCRIFLPFSSSLDRTTDKPHSQVHRFPFASYTSCIYFELLLRVFSVGNWCMCPQRIQG